jgi:hypothetical protein
MGADRFEGGTMGVLNRFFGHSDRGANPLLGCWQLVRAAEDAVEPAEAEFREDGWLLYSVLSGSRWQVMRLKFRVEGDLVVTDQPSAPREERTRYSLEPDGTLLLEFGGTRSRYRRASKVAPGI